MREEEVLGCCPLGRRAFLKGGTLLLAAAAGVPGQRLLAMTSQRPALRLGLVTDLHSADKASRGTRYYRQTLAKFAEANRQFAQEKPDLLIGLGDLIDAADSLEVEKSCLERIARQFADAPGQHHHVLGNHCVSSLTKAEFLHAIGQKASFYSFEAGDYHMVVLDACFRADGQPYGRNNFTWTDANIPPAEVQWLRADLANSSRKTLVFIHQRLDVQPPLGVKNAPEIRAILEASGKVLAVLQGHDHAGDYREIGGIHYCTLKAMIEGSGPENNAYAIMDVLPGNALQIRGFRKQASYRWVRS